MYYLPSFSLFLFFLFCLFHPFPCSSSKYDGGCKDQFQCGNITAGFPFWGGNRHHHCGHPLLELHCFNTTTSITISDHLYHVLHINHTSNTLRLARTDYFDSFCSSTSINATLPPEIFDLSSTYESITFSHCDLSSYRCPGTGAMTPILVFGNPEHHHESCHPSFTVNVPKSFVTKEKKVNITNLESILEKGFEVKVKIDMKACQECSSSYGFCGFNKYMPLDVKCIPPEPLTAEELHTRCRQLFTCGNQNDLFYPFWIPDRESCGHPDFKVECNTGFAEFNISSVKFRILEANSTSRVFRLARSDYISNLCPQNPPNAPVNENILPFTRGTELLTIYNGCQDFSLPNYAGEFDCDGVDRKSYYVIRNLLPSLPPEFGTLCNSDVRIPVSGPSLNTLKNNLNEDNLKKALEEGFEVGLNQECLMCMNSGGACGYNQPQTVSGFVCYCIDGIRNHTCGYQKKDAGLSKGVIAVIAVGASVLGLAMLILAGWFCLIRRRRMTQEAQYTSKDLPITSYSSRETSRPTSTTISSSSNHSLLPSLSNIANGSTYFGVQVFSYEELEEATENFSRELGDGGFGTVYYGILKDGRAVAVKRLYERSLKRVEQFKNEIEILKSLKHPNLVILYGCTSRHSRELLLVYEYISNGTLADHLHGDQAVSRPLCWSVRLNVAIETASALSFLHKKAIIHRDVKTTNILLDENYQVKVADFGLSRLFPLDQTHISTAPQGTPGYVDPEYYQCYRLNEKSDVYSFGVVLTELISSKEAVDITRHRHDINLANMAVSKIQNNALHELVDPSLGFEKDLDVRKKMMSVAELAFRCLQQEREVRPAMDEIVEILREIKEEGKSVVMMKSPDVVDIEGGGGDDVGLLRHSVPPPISPETDKWTSSSDTAASI